MDAGRFGGTAADDPHHDQLAPLRLELDPQADEIPLDLRIDLAELVRGEVGGIGIQAVGRPAETLEDCRGRAHLQALLGQRGQRRHGVAGVLAGCRRSARPASCAPPRGRARWPASRGRECSVALKTGSLMRHLEIAGPAGHQVAPIGLLDVVRLDLQQHARVQVQRLLRRQLRQRPAKAAVGIAAAQIIVQAGRLETPLQALLVRVKPQGVFVVGDRFAPPPLRLPTAGLAGGSFRPAACGC